MRHGMRTFEGCNRCKGCKQLLKNRGDFHDRCKLFEEIEADINKKLILFMDLYSDKPKDEYERWLISQRNKFETCQQQLTDTLQRINTERDGEILWCNVNCFWWENVETLKLLNDELNKLKPQPAATPQRGDTNNHFNSQFTDEELKTLFERLKGCEIDTDSRLEDWLYVCRGGDKPSGHSALKWLKTAALLAKLCDTLFKDTDTNRVWVIAANCFCKSDGGQYNSATFPQSLSRGTISGKDALLEKLKL